MDRKLTANLPQGTKSYELVHPVYTIGRDAACEVSVDHPSLSRQHAKLLLTEASCTLVDLGSRNGTWLNGQRMHGEAVLKSGDEFRCGSISFTFEDGTPEEVGSGFRARKAGIAGVLASDLEIGEKFKQSTKMLTYGFILPTLNWKLRMFLFVFTTIIFATVVLLAAASSQARVAEMKYFEGLAKAFAYENLVVFEQDLPYFGNMALWGEAAISESYLLDAEGYPVFPPERPKARVDQLAATKLADIKDVAVLQDAKGKMAVMPVQSGGKVMGYAILRWDPGKRVRSRFIEAAIVVGAILVTMVGFGSVYTSSRIISKPIKNLDQEIELMMSGQLSELSTYGGFPELNDVVKSVYLLVMRLRASRDA